MWLTRDQKGCYALCEVESEVHEDRVNEEEIHYYNQELNDEPFDQVELKITHNLAENPITYDQIKEVDALIDLKAGNQGTNFAATKEEYEAILKMAELKFDDKKYWLYSPGSQAEMWDDFYEDGIMALGWDELENLEQYKSKEEIVTKLQEIFDTDSSKKMMPQQIGTF